MSESSSTPISPEPQPLNTITLAEALQDTALLINQSLKLNEVLEQILNVIGKVVPHNAANIMLLDGNLARMTAWRGYDAVIEKTLANQVRNIDHVPNLRRMVDTSQPIVIPDTRASSDWVNLNTSYWIRSYVSAPICHNNQAIGFINLNSEIPGYYTSLHAERLRAFASQAAVAIQNAKLYEKAQQELAERERAERALQQTLDELEHRVELRTQELKEANARLNQELSRRILAETILEEERALLALRIKERTAELSFANSELAKAAQMKDAFLASMSHELRTPLSAILNNVETLIEQVYGPLTPEQARALTTIEERAEHLLVLINDVLDLSKIGAGKLNLTIDTVSVQAICESSLKFIKEYAHNKQIALSIQIDPAVKTAWADPRRLKQILVNLLNNAVKFTPQGGAVGIDVNQDSTKKQVNFTVWDTGIGIPRDKMELLFMPFMQLDYKLGRQYGGAGLGLALVYNLVELHEAGISLESELDHGSRFTISIQSEPEPTHWADDKVEALTEHLAQVSDDENNFQPTLTLLNVLNDLKYDVSGYWFDPDAIQTALDTRPDLFVFDLRLLKKDMNLLARLKNQPLSANTPILILTHQRIIDRPSVTPGVWFLEYPFTQQEVIDLLQKISPARLIGIQPRAAVIVERKRNRQGRIPVVLLVDDHQSFIRGLSDALTVRGIELALASNSAEALEWARASSPDMILFNVQMPGTTGFEFVQKVRSDPRLAKLPLVAISSITLPGVPEQFALAGTTNYLTRPVHIPYLLEIIQQHLGKTFEPGSVEE